MCRPKRRSKRFLNQYLVPSRSVKPPVFVRQQSARSPDEEDGIVSSPDRKRRDRVERHRRVMASALRSMPVSRDQDSNATAVGIDHVVEPGAGKRLTEESSGTKTRKVAPNLR